MLAQREAAMMQHHATRGLAAGIGRLQGARNAGAITPQIRVRKDLTFKEELQDEIDQWLKDI